MVVVNNSVVYQFIEIMKEQLNNYCPSLQYFVYGDHVAAQLLNTTIYNINMFVETPSAMDNYKHFLVKLPHTCISIFNIFYPNITITNKCYNGYNKCLEFYLNMNDEPLFCINYAFDSHLTTMPYLNYEMLSQDKYGNISLLYYDYPIVPENIFTILKGVHEKKLVSHYYITTNSFKLRHNNIIQYIRCIQKRLKEGWKIEEKIRNNELYQSECVICYESFKRTPLIGLNCNHYFHLNCFKQYIENDHETNNETNTLQNKLYHNCPTCKQNIKQLKLKYYSNNNEQKTTMQSLQKHV